MFGLWFGKPWLAQLWMPTLAMVQVGLSAQSVGAPVPAQTFCVCGGQTASLDISCLFVKMF